uniref:Cocaine- and amphetamine-regulated transcript protein n=1 Tax=Denticeps clupeoides TaxID=299321 RepID=A0AAY4E1B2_9TELE
MARTGTLLLALCVLLCSVSPASPARPGEQKRELSLYLYQLGVLQNVLEKLQNRRMTIWERKHSRLPNCNVGDFCTVKKGPRFGQLCDCPRGSKCNLFFLKCL